MKRIKMCDTAFIDSRCNEKTVGRFVLIFFDLSKMTRNGFTLHFILTLTRLHRDLYGQRKIVIVTDNVSHVAGCCRHRLTIIIEFQVGMDIATIKHCHGAPCIPLKHQRCVVEIILLNFLERLDYICILLIVFKLFYLIANKIIFSLLDSSLQLIF